MYSHFSPIRPGHFAASSVNLKFGPPISLTTGDPSPRRPGPRASSRRRDVELVKFCVTVDSAVWGSNLHIYVPVSHELDCLFDSSHSRGPPKGHGTSHISAGDDIVHEIATASRQAYRHYAASARVRSKLPNFKTDAAASTPPPASGRMRRGPRVGSSRQPEHAETMPSKKRNRHAALPVRKNYRPPARAIHERAPAGVLPKQVSGFERGHP